MRANIVNRRNDYLDRQARERASARQLMRDNNQHERTAEQEMRTAIARRAGLSKSQRRRVPITLAPVVFLTCGDAE